MSISVEFYGIPRQRAGVATTMVDGADLGAVLAAQAEQFPDFGAACVDAEQLRPGYVVNLGGDRFVRDPRTPPKSG